ncbi:MAG: L,D-transpeptidase [Clostridiales bacterium]|nr:L,D-transpeptidase [Clostridiales bacterium]
MKRRLNLVLIIMIIIAIIAAAGCVNRPAPPEERPSPRRQTEQPKEDRLAKSDKEAVEENINGYSIKDDLRITGTAQEDGRRKISALDRQRSLQMVKKVGSKKMNAVLHEYSTTLSEGINDSVQYTRYSLPFDYFLVTAENGAKVRENPVQDSATVATVGNLDKLSLLRRVESDEYQGSNIWYRVGFWDGTKTGEGYLHSTEGTPRNFRFDRMQDAVNELKQQVAQGPLHFISNYKNQNGPPPRKGDAAVDEHGYRVYHSAPAYFQADTGGDFRYIPDGMLVRILDETGDLYHVDVPSFDRDFYVSKKYIDADATLSRLNHVVVVDRTHQNQAAFEVAGDTLNLVSFTLATTGFPGEYSFETTLGSYKAIEKKDRFEYLKSDSPDIAGYAPFALRFTGGAYIHGVPVAYEEQDGERVDPGHIEYLHTIGTFPRSNMCVRNYTSHAEFLYNWMDYQNGAVIVIE